MNPLRLHRETSFSITSDISVLIVHCRLLIWRLVGAEGLQYSLMGAVNVRTFISEYRQFGQLMVPTKIIQELGPGQTMQLTIESIQFDSVEPSTFALPASIEALVG